MRKHFFSIYYFWIVHFRISRKSWKNLSSVLHTAIHIWLLLVSIELKLLIMFWCPFFSLKYFASVFVKHIYHNSCRNSKEMFSHYYMHSDVCNIKHMTLFILTFSLRITQQCVVEDHCPCSTEETFLQVLEEMFPLYL